MTEPDLARRLGACAAVAALLTAAPSAAETMGEAGDGAALSELVVTGRTSQTMALPVAVANDSVERVQLEASNIINADDALRYVANFQIRKRYIGDQNGAPAVRGSNGPQSARALVLLDGIPISNLLGSGFAFSPKWGLIAPDEIESVDVMYGPHSVLHSGNTLAAGVFITTRTPERFEASAGALAGVQRFHGYDTSLDLKNRQFDASIGDRRGAFAWSLYANHFDAQGNPGNFLTVPVSSGSTTLPGRPVIGVIRETDAAGIDRWIFGTSSVFDESADLVKAKASWEVDESTRLFGTLAWRDQLSKVQNPRSYLRDAAGNEIRTGRVSLGGRSFNLDTLNTLQRSIVNTQDILAGVTLQRRLAPGLALEAAVSRFEVLDADTRTAFIAADPVGQVNLTDDQGWQNAAVRLVWEPKDRPLAGRKLTFGGDYAEYWTGNSVYNSADYAAGARGTLAERNRGRTELLGLFAETTWGLTGDVDLTGGLRWERWKASDGLRTAGALSIAYPEREEDHWSPKLVLTWRANPDWTLSLRAAEAYRFATVSELFQARTTGGALIQSDPNLRPERARDLDLTAVRRLDLPGEARGKLTFSVYREDVENVIYSQYNLFTQATYNQNVDHVLSHGIDVGASLFGLMNGRLDLDANLSHLTGEIEANAGQPATVGKDFPRIPNWRGKLLAVYRPTDRLTASLGLRYEGRQYNDLLNSDDRSGGFGYMSEYLMVDVKAQYRVSDQITASLGIDNLTDELAYYFHPYPMRTFVASLRWRR